MTTNNNVLTEHITFVPHPKTLTMAGDYAYFAAQGHHPFPYALAELIDNSLRALKGRNTADHIPTTPSGSIRVTFALQSDQEGLRTPEGVIVVEDDGCGMGKQSLGEWAVMSLTMEDRAQGPRALEAPHHGAAKHSAARFLTGDLSFFGVGSKAAAFYIGGVVKVVTKTADSPVVHELSINADELEQRYTSGQPVYEGQLIMRPPGDTSTLLPFETPVPLLKTLIENEATYHQDVPAASSSFTRVVVGNLKPEIVEQILDGSSCDQVCRDLAHLYHYYLHGEQGRREAAVMQQPGASQAPAVPRLPQITVQLQMGQRQLWSRVLSEVDDDAESRYLAAQKAQMEFSLQVEGKGDVLGRLWYFPYENEQETYPQVGNPWSRKPLVTYNMTQHPAMTQRLPAKVVDECMALTQAAAGDDAENAGMMMMYQPLVPVLEAFWQGRLIPGARVESLPFIEAVRQKRHGAGKERLPDEVFKRIRGVLFFDCTYLVTRNKLTFRDNLQELLASATSVERNIEKRFRDWLARCHAELDKIITYQRVAPAPVQAEVRQEHGEQHTAFLSITDGSMTATAGDVVRLAGKAPSIGRVNYFLVPQVVHQPGQYAHGRVSLSLLPSKVHGSEPRLLPVRRVEASLTEQAAQEIAAKELLKLPAALLVEPMSLTGGKLQLTAGDELPGSTVIIMNGHRQKISKATINGAKQLLAVVQKLLLLGDASATAEGLEAVKVAQAEIQAKAQEVEEIAYAVSSPGPPRKRKGRKNDGAVAKRRANASANAAVHLAEVEGSGAKGALVSRTVVDAPDKDAYTFPAAKLNRAGSYKLLYEVQPHVYAPGPHERLTEEPLAVVIEVDVAPQSPATLDVKGEGRAVLTGQPIVLGQLLPSLTVVRQDPLANEVPFIADSAEACGAVLHLEGANSTCLAVHCEQVLEDGCLQLQALQITCPVPLTCSQPLPGLEVFAPTDVVFATPQGSALPAAQPPAPAPDATCLTALLTLSVEVLDLPAVPLPFYLRPGAPCHLQLQPGHCWDNTAGTWSVLQLDAGQPIPDFQVKCLDAWGNLSGPCSQLPFVLQVASPGSPPVEVPVSSTGLATISNLKATTGGQQDMLTITVHYTEQLPPAIQAAVNLAPAAPMQLPVCTAAPRVPSKLLITLDDKEVPCREEVEEDGHTTLVYQLGSHMVGSVVEGVGLNLVDAEGKPMDPPVHGRIALVYLSKRKKTELGGAGVTLPPIELPETAHQVLRLDIGFRPGDALLPTLEATMEIDLLPGPPVAWAVSLVHEVTAGPDCTARTTRGNPETPSGEIKCGVPFLLEVEALDAFNNRCQGGAAILPNPVIQPQSDGLLHWDEEAWEKKWCTSQGNQDVYMISMTLWGEPGKVRLLVSDGKEQGPQADGPWNPLASATSGNTAAQTTLRADQLMVDLLPGPPKLLRFKDVSSLECSTVSTIKELCVVSEDGYGNAVALKGTTEVHLRVKPVHSEQQDKPAVLGPAGLTAKLKKGTCTFRNIQIAADTDGEFMLLAEADGLEAAKIPLQLHACNAVQGLDVVLPTSPMTVTAGEDFALQVGVATSDGLVLEQEASALGLTLHVQLQGSRRSDAVVVTCASQGTLTNVEGSHQQWSMFDFDVPGLQSSGTYYIAAQFTETREELAAALGRGKVTMRSTAVTLQVDPGPAAAVTLESDDPPDPIAVTNGVSSKQRTLLLEPVFQLRDEFGNEVATEGLLMCLMLVKGEQELPEGAVLPELECSSNALTVSSNSNGQFTLPDIKLQQDTGSNAGHSSLECRVQASVSGLQSCSSLQWDTVWTARVLIADDAARHEAVKALQEQRAAVEEALEALQQRVQHKKEVVSMAEAQHLAAQNRVQQQKATWVDGPESSEAAHRLREVAQQRLAAAEEQEEPAMVARFGPAQHPITKALKRIEQLQHVSVFGITAKLATVDDVELNRVLSLAMRPVMPVLVVKDRACQAELSSHLRSANLPEPDMLALTHAQPYRARQGDTCPPLKGASERAQALHQAACGGTDGPLEIPLPHIRGINHLQKQGQALQIDHGPDKPAADRWPSGCLGYTVNLVRPAAPGQRATVLYPVLINMLIFETLSHAQRYREYCTQDLHTQCPDLITLDLRRITAKGITCGASFNPPPLEKTDFRFGSSPQDQQAHILEARQQLKQLEGLLPALQQLEEAEQQLTAAQEEETTVVEGLQREVEELQQQLADLDQQLLDAAGECALPTQQPRPSGRASRRSGRSSKSNSTNRQGQVQGTEAVEQRRLQGMDQLATDVTNEDAADGCGPALDEAVGHEPTHHVAKERRNKRLMKNMRK